ncbi:MAG TPA: cyclopropane-fatty-acyl-phospholipid synthase family protein [Burkholderiales bacterium]|nr:cyclopropane-fatty-acyl-phospholipid synthase family protein [Burkholderiales bacterium]
MGSVRGGRVVESRLGKLVERVRATEPVPLRIRLWTGRSYELGPDPATTLVVPSPRALRYLGSPDLMKLGEAYVEGHIDLEGRVSEAFHAGERFVRAVGEAKVLAPLRRSRHTRRVDKKAIEYHYDVSNDFYRLILDRSMVYSCAYYRTEADTLDVAQEQKLDHILTKLRLRPGERLLDIGCGWGALIMRAVEKFGAQAVGVTLSKNQFEHARDEIRARGIGDRCEVRLQDYRDIPDAGGYDKIASVGMFEHVGLKNLVPYFRQIHRLLKDGGLALNHGITSVDHESRAVGMGAGEFIERYVFPYGELPHIGLVLREMSAAGLEVTDVESLRRHYAKTCAAWAANLETNAARAREIAGERRYRIWSVYLAGCAYGFAHNWINIYQALACKQGGPGMNPLPLTREFMYGAG